MKYILGLFALIVVSALSLSAQSLTAAPQQSPKAVVNGFLTSVINGQLQTTKGWQQVNAFFAHPSSMPQDQPVIVIGTDCSTQQAWVRGNHAEVVATYRELGRIDPSLRFHQPLASPRKISVRYLLVYASSSATTAGANGSGSRQWRIQNPSRFVWTGLPAAVRYVTQARANTNNAVTKKNADVTLSQLSKLE